MPRYRIVVRLIEALSYSPISAETGVAPVIKIKVSSKGQVVIPIEVRTRFNIDTGTELELRESSGYISLHPLPDDPVRATRGLLRPAQESRSLVRELLQTKRGVGVERSRGRPAWGTDRDQDAHANPFSHSTLFDPPTR